MDVTTASDRCAAVFDAVERAVIAHRTFLKDVLTGILSRGHVLLEDVPGTGKTLTARSMSTALGLSFSRIQFTPDLLPADITGTHIYNQQDRSFEFRKGPIFANVVLADEINRAPPKTQAALLEAMEERQVTVGDETHELPEPFFVLATQNPVEQEGTFVLPEAQLDRFTIKASLGYPKRDGEIEILQRRTERIERSPTVGEELSLENVRQLQQVPETIRVEPDLIAYMTDIARATREEPRVNTGVSPRGTQRLLETSRARAVIDSRDFVTPDDIKRVANPVLAHRLILTAEATVQNVDKRDVISEVINQVHVPTLESASS
jgi:MoxR-like ATPase